MSPTINLLLSQHPMPLLASDTERTTIGVLDAWYMHTLYSYTRRSVHFHTGF